MPRRAESCFARTAAAALLLTRSEVEALIMEFHSLERLAADRVYEFAYVATTNATRGTVAGTALHPLALR